MSMLGVASSHLMQNVPILATRRELWSPQRISRFLKAELGLWRVKEQAGIEILCKT